MSDGASDDDVGPEPGREVWIEKYRPESLDDVLGHEKITERLRGYVDRNDVPHLLFAGPAGTGKCVTGETPVLTNRGTERIDDIVGEVEGFGPLPAGLKVVTLGEDGTFRWVRPAAGFGKRTDDLVSVRTRDGAVLTVTPEHKLLVDGDGTGDGDGSGLAWKAASDLSPGEAVVRPRRLPRPPLSVGTNRESRHLFADGGMVRPQTTPGPSADLSFDEIESVRRLREERRVYDLTVPGTRNYVAGNVPTVMHNTTAAVAIARELYGEEWRENFLELNASDERGIDVVRERIKNFARASFGGQNYRIIFLDEADALTSEAQAALRRTMEQFSNNTRFILSCNFSSDIIDPIQSRCTVFRFSPLDDEAVAEQIRLIAEQEGIELTDAGVDALVYVADGDMRKAINRLQAAAVMGETVDEDVVFEITSAVPPEEMRELVTQALAGDFSQARSRLDDMITEAGVAGGDIIDQIHRSVWEFELDDEEAVALMERLGETDYRITAGANEQVQLEALLASLSLGQDEGDRLD